MPGKQLQSLGVSVRKPVLDKRCAHGARRVQYSQTRDTETRERGMYPHSDGRAEERSARTGGTHRLWRVQVHVYPSKGCT